MYVRPRWKLVSFHMELKPRRLIFSFPLLLSSQNSSGWWWAVERLTHCFGFNFGFIPNCFIFFLYCLSFYPLNPRLPTSSMFVVLLFFSWHTFYLKVPFPSSANQSFISSNCHLMPAHLLVSLWFPEMVGSNIPSHIYFIFFFCVSHLCWSCHPLFEWLWW